MPDATSSSTTPYAIDTHRLAETAAHPGVGRSFRPFLRGRRSLVERLRTPGGAAVLLPPGLRPEPDHPAQLDLARRHPDRARKLECRLALGVTEHPPEPRIHPSCPPLCANPLATPRLGRLHPPGHCACRGGTLAGRIVDYREEGWLWPCSAYASACMSMQAAADIDGAGQSPAPAARATMTNI